MSTITVLDQKKEPLQDLTVPLGLDPNDRQIDVLTTRGPLGQRLLSADLIREEELEAALKNQVEKGQKLGESLLELGFAFRCAS